MIEFSGVSFNPKMDDCDVPNCKNGACTSVWNYPGTYGTSQFNLCGWHVKDLYERMHVGKTYVDKTYKIDVIDKSPKKEDKMNAIKWSSWTNWASLNFDKQIGSMLFRQQMTRESGSPILRFEFKLTQIKPKRGTKTVYTHKGVKNATK